MGFFYNYPHLLRYLFSPSLRGRVVMPVVLLARAGVGMSVPTCGHTERASSLLPPPPVLSIDPLYIYRLCAHRRRPTWPRNGRVAAMQTLM